MQRATTIAEGLLQVTRRAEVQEIEGVEHDACACDAAVLQRLKRRHPVLVECDDLTVDDGIEASQSDSRGRDLRVVRGEVLEVA